MRKLIVLLLLPLLLLAGCTYHRTPVKPPRGLIFSEYRAPLSVDLEGKARANPSKVGTAQSRALLGFAWENCDVKTAAANGGITTIHYADYEVLNVLMIYSEFTVMVYGE